MNEKKYYIWQLASFLFYHKKYMSGEELAEHLNRNDFRTSYGTEFQGGRGIYTLIKETYNWLENNLHLTEEASKVAEVFVKPNGDHAW